jgi:hypothetical protein
MKMELFAGISYWVRLCRCTKYLAHGFMSGAMLILGACVLMFEVCL